MTIDRPISLMLCGDVMTGRGIDQALPHPGAPVLHEAYARSALDYVALAETANGPIKKPLPFASIWGDALGVCETLAPDLTIVNLETAVTRSDKAWPKGINYRMNPGNVACLTAAGLDCCVLANNHVLDWGREGLVETLDVLHHAGLATAGAGRDAEEAARPAVLPVAGKGRVLVHALACASSGVPSAWAASAERPGVNFLAEPSPREIDRIAGAIEKTPGDVVVLSLHWGPNWGYAVDPAERAFARGLVERGAVDVVFGHSSHHAKAIEVHRNRPILYGCGDFLNDYEGIAGYEAYRGDLVLAYRVSLHPSDRRLVDLTMAPFRIRRFRLERADGDEREWLRSTMDRECRSFGGAVAVRPDGTLALDWHNVPG